jgi:hypothetical protein
VNASVGSPTVRLIEDGALLIRRVAELKANAPLKFGRKGETSERCLNSPPRMKECLPCSHVRLSANW